MCDALGEHFSVCLPMLILSMPSCLTAFLLLVCHLSIYIALRPYCSLLFLSAFLLLCQDNLLLIAGLPLSLSTYIYIYFFFFFVFLFFLRFIPILTLSLSLSATHAVQCLRNCTRY